MCKVRDIIVVEAYEHEGQIMDKHSFVVIDDQKDEIQGLDYDFVANVMSSFKSDKQKVRKLSYPGNFSVELNDRVTDPDNGKEGFVKADQLYYFKKDKINFNIIGEIKEDKFNELIEFINNLECDLQEIIGNLK